MKKVLAVGHKLAERLTRLADDLERGVQEREAQTHLVGRVASFSGMALSAGFVAWILRGGRSGREFPRFDASLAAF